MKMLDMVALILLLVGGVNWGLVGFFNFDLVAHFLGDATTGSKVVYDIVGLCALYQAYKHFQNKCSQSS
jgi:uncharacterized membrane protein YuzA (DUF378 family)